MKEFRIYYKTVGIETAVTPLIIIKAATAEEALEVFQARRPWSDVVAIFAD